jgi:hypothetical protein
MASVPAVFRAVVLGLAAAILASYQTPLGPEQWAKRYATLLAESPLDDPAVIPRPPYPAAKGVYAPNVLLQSLTKLGEGLLIAPEDFELDPTNTFFYVSNAGGWIRKLYLATGQVQNWESRWTTPATSSSANQSNTRCSRCEHANPLLNSKIP